MSLELKGGPADGMVIPTPNALEVRVVVTASDSWAGGTHWYDRTGEYIGGPVEPVAP